jgi:hypothetical protein
MVPQPLSTFNPSNSSQVHNSYFLGATYAVFRHNAHSSSYLPLPQTMSSYSDSALHVVVRGGGLSQPATLAEVNRLVNEDPRLVNQPGTLRRTPLILASAAGQLKVCLTRSQLGFPPSPRKWTGRNGEANCWGGSCDQGVVRSGVSMCCPQVVDFLLSRGARVDDVDRYNWTALHHATAGGYLKIAQLLLDKVRSIVPGKTGTPYGLAPDEIPPRT